MFRELIIVCIATTSAFAQGGVDASTYPGADICEKMRNAMLAVSGTNGIVNVTTLSRTGTPCASNPFDGVTGYGKLRIGEGTIDAATSWQVPNFWQIEGSGRGGTTIRATGSFSGNKLIILGPGDGISFGVRLENLVINCNGLHNIDYCVYSSSIQEQSGLEHVVISGIWSTGLKIDWPGGNPPQNWHTHDLEIYSDPASTNGSFIGMDITGASSGSHEMFLGVTIVGPPAGGLGVGVRMNGVIGGHGYSIHCERLAYCVETGTSSSNFGLTVANINGGVGLTTLIHVGNSLTQQGLSFIGISKGGYATNLVDDNIKGLTVTRGVLASYITGNESAATSAGPIFGTGFSVGDTTCSWNKDLTGFVVSDNCTGISVNQQEIRNNGYAQKSTATTILPAGQSRTVTVTLPPPTTYSPGFNFRIRACTVFQLRACMEYEMVGYAQAGGTYNPYLISETSGTTMLIRNGTATDGSHVSFDVVNLNNTFEIDLALTIESLSSSNRPYLSFSVGIPFSSGAVTKPSSTWDRIKATTASLGGASLSGFQCSTIDTTVPGARIGMTTIATPNGNPGATFLWAARVKSDDTVETRVCGAGTPSALPYFLEVFRY